MHFLTNQYRLRRQRDLTLLRLAVLLFALLFGALFLAPTANAQSGDPIVVDGMLNDSIPASDTWLIGLDQTAAADDLALELRSQGLELVRLWPDFHLAEVRVLGQDEALVTSSVAATESMERQRQSLESLPNVRYVTPNLRVYAADRLLASAGKANSELLPTAIAPNDPLASEQWALDRVQFSAAWNITQGNNEVIVAIIDSGFDLAHEDIADTSLWTNRAEADGEPWVDDDGNGFYDDLHGWDWVQNDAETNDPYGHGTHVGGTLAATTNNRLGIAGLGGNVKIMPLRVLDQYGSGMISDLVDALYYAVQADARVVNLSLVLQFDSPAVADAVHVAAEAGVLVVAATGNANTGVYWPAVYPETLAVAATDSEDRRAGFSNFGPAVDVAAPGVNILGTYRSNSYASLSGTSMATPHVSALAGLVWSLRPDLLVEEVADLIRRNAVDVNVDDSPGFDPDIGHGRIDFYAALLEASSALNITPKVEGVHYSPPGKPLAVAISVTVVAVGDEVGRPVGGAVVQFSLDSVEAGDTPTGVGGQIVSDENGLATVAFKAPGVSGDYALQVQVGMAKTTIPVTVSPAPHHIVVTPASSITTAGAVPVSLSVGVVDADGAPVDQELTLALETDLGHWGTLELTKTVEINNGVFEASFFPGEVKGVATIVVRERNLSTSVTIEVQSDVADRIELSADDPQITVAADADSTEVTFVVRDRFGNLVADGTRVQLFTSDGILSASDLLTQNGEVTVTLNVSAGAESSVQLWAMVPGTHAQTELTVAILSDRSWLPIIVGGYRAE